MDHLDERTAEGADCDHFLLQRGRQVLHDEDLALPEAEERPGSAEEADDESAPLLVFFRLQRREHLDFVRLKANEHPIGKNRLVH